MQPGAPCEITSTSSVSTEIPTVGIVEWSLDGVESARIEFGKDTNYGMTAPVDLQAPNYRTLLLGMEGSSTYHYRVVATVGGQECTGADQTLMTGAVPNSLQNLTVETMGEVAPGYLITTTYSSGMDGPAYILNEAGNVVWYYTAVGEPSRARMSYDGKYMWMGRANVPDRGAQMVRVAMDGSEEQDLSGEFEAMNHDFVVLPDESVVFIAYGNGCDDVRRRMPDGSVTTLINSSEASGAGMCHLNSIGYSPEDETIVFSDLTANHYVKITLEGEIVWILGGDNSDFSGEGATWTNQHGLHMLGLDRILIFNNGGGGGGDGSLAIEIALDLTQMSATRSWSYGAGISNQVMGDVQRLENGNTLVVYSTQGVIHEVDPEMNLVQSIESSGVGAAFGYADKRTSLYGAPPR
jgi:hypothetical protein